jgi:hypothetical protein
MSFVRRRRRLGLVLVALLVAAGLQVAADALLHTDDGCPLETHCLVCQAHFGATVIPAVGPSTPAPVELARLTPLAPAVPDRAEPTLQVSPRGPPLT